MQTQVRKSGVYKKGSRAGAKSGIGKMEQQLADLQQKLQESVQEQQQLQQQLQRLQEQEHLQHLQKQEEAAAAPQQKFQELQEQVDKLQRQLLHQQKMREQGKELAAALVGAWIVLVSVVCAGMVMLVVGSVFAFMVCAPAAWPPRLPNAQLNATRPGGGPSPCRRAGAHCSL